MGTKDRTFPPRVLVTGAAGAVGVELCRKLLGVGIHVIATDKKISPQLEAIRAKTLTWVEADLESSKDRKKIVQEVVASQENSIGIIHNASFVGDSNLPGWLGPFQSQTDETWRRAIDVGLTAAFSLTRDISAKLELGAGSAIVHISSIYSALGPEWALYEGTDMGNPAAYGVAKAGLEQLTRWLAVSLAPHARVNAVSPGGIYRNQPPQFVEKYEARVPLSRMATEQDVCDAVLFLLSSHSSYVTGQVLIVDGGFSIK